MGFNSGLAERPTYAAYNTDLNEFVSDDEANHTIVLILDGASLGAPTNAIVSLGDGVYEITLTDAERTGVDLIIKGSSATANIIIMPMHYAADPRWTELIQNDAADLQLTAKALELAPIADVSGLALESSVQLVLSTGGAGPWQTAATAGLALESSVQLVLSTGGTGPWTTGGGGAGDKDWTDEERSHIRNRLGIDGAAAVPSATPTLSLQATSDLILSTGADGPWTTYGGGGGTIDANVISWQNVLIDGTNMIEDPSGVPRWTQRALENAPAGDGSVTYVGLPTTNKSGYLDILRGDTLDYNETLNVSLSFTTEIWYTIKRSTDDLDSEALLKISMTGGLEVINGAPATTAADGSITVDAERSGVIRIQCIAARMAELPKINRGAVLDIQLKSEGNIWTVFTRKVSIIGDVTRAIL